MFPDLDVSFFPFRPFWDFPDFLRDFPGDCSGIFPICPFPLARPIDSTYKEQSQKGPRHNLDLPRKKWETPRFGNPPAQLLPTLKVGVRVNLVPDSFPKSSQISLQLV